VRVSQKKDVDHILLLNKKEIQLIFGLFLNYCHHDILKLNNINCKKIKIK